MNDLFAARSEDVVVGADQLRSLCDGIYRCLGVPDADAAVVAGIHVWTDLRGIPSHGTRLLPGYARALREGKLKAQPSIGVVREGPAFAVLDGDGGIGHLAARQAMLLAVEKARQSGIGAVAVANSRHFGAASAYSTIASEQGMIGFCTSNSGTPLVLPFGGREPATANNPLSWAIPAGAEPAVVLDMACGVAASGHVGTLRLYGQPLPGGWMLTRDGRPARDWSEAANILPAAGPKGYGLALAMSALGVLCGGLMPTSKSDGLYQEHFLMAIDTESFGDRQQFAAEVARAATAIRATPPAEGFDRVYLPGEVEALKARRWQEAGIPIHRDHLAELLRTAAECGVAPPSNGWTLAS